MGIISVAEKTEGILGCIRKAEGEDPSSFPGLDPVLGSPVQDRQGHTGVRLM